MGGWTPRRDGDDERTPSPPVSRRSSTRRRRKELEPNTPTVQRMQASNPRVSTNARPPAGKIVDERHGGKVRVGARWSGIIKDVKAGEYTWQEFCDGLDEEELARGQLRADNGTFIGRPPQFVPREFLLACQREQKRRFEELFGSEVLGLTKEFLRLCKDKSIPPEKRAKLLQYAMERVFGGIPKDVRISQEQPWEAMVVNVVSDGESGLADHKARRYAGYKERLGEASDDEPD